MIKWIISFLSVAAILATMVPAAFAVSGRYLRVSVIDADTNEEIEVQEYEDFEEAEVIVDDEVVDYVSARQKPYVNCYYELPKNDDGEEELVNSAAVVAVKRKLRVETDTYFRVKVYVRNDGNAPWFSANSGCRAQLLSLGTDKPRDGEGLFYTPSTDGHYTGWIGPNRVAMDQLRINPGEIASFTIWSDSGDREGVFKQFMTPVVEGLEWLDDSQFSYGVVVGDLGYHSGDIRSKLLYGNDSGDVTGLDLNAERSLLVDRSDQHLIVMLGDYVVREFPMSSGAAKTPTPVGETTIKLKQRVRVGGKAPHYIMPNFLWFRAGGYGLHGLPSLGSASLRYKIKSLQAAGQEVPVSLYTDDPFWTEALGHIGTPVSHGCIRLLPEDSDFLFNFAEVEPRVKVQM